MESHTLSAAPAPALVRTSSSSSQHTNKQPQPPQQPHSWYWFQRKWGLVAILIAGSIISDRQLTQRSSDFLVVDSLGQQPQHNPKNGTAAAVRKLTAADQNQLPICLSHQCIHDVVRTIPPHVYAVPTNTSGWCRLSQDDDDNDDNNDHGGLWVVRIPHADNANRISASVAQRLAHNHPCQPSTNLVDVEQMHQHQQQQQAAENAKNENVFRFTMLVDPRERDSRNRTAESNHDNSMSLPNQTILQLDHISPSSSSPDPELVQQRVQDTLQTFDMILTLDDRLDDGLVVMALLLGVDVSDVLVSSSLSKGPRYRYEADGTCRETIETTTTTKTTTTAQFYGDLLLIEAAHQVLDRTIDRVVGRNQFVQARERFRRLQALEHAHCAPFVQYPCSSVAGQPQLHISHRTCYEADQEYGCGYRCVDELVEWDRQQQQQGATMERDARRRR